jgi:hypothetical protein
VRCCTCSPVSIDQILNLMLVSIKILNRWVPGLGKDAQDCRGPVLSRCMHAARDIAALAEISNFSFLFAINSIQHRHTPSKRVLVVFGQRV